jgi:cellulose synthase/poly-beta-1,6-N-acetylglucosamine synthase-like glycosyltransferase
VLASFLATGAACCLLLALHPFVTYPLALAALARLRPRPLRITDSVPSRLAVCICAYNEAAVIGDRVRNLLALRDGSPGLEILVYVDGSTDRTADILAEFGDTIRTVVSTQRLGKTHGMNLLVGMTSAEIVVFSDANVSFTTGTLPRLVAPFRDPSVGCVCGHLLYTGGNGDTAATGSLYWRLEEHIKALESATGSVMGADGSIFAIRRSLHTPPPPYLIDDLYVSLSVLCRGSRIVRAADALAYEAAVSTSQEEFRRKVRIACQAFNVHRALRPSLRRLGVIDQFKYVSHKVLRWLCVFFLAGAGVLSGAALAVAQMWIALLAFAAACAVGGAAIFLSRRGPAAKLREILAAFIATGWGVLRSLRGDRFQTWTPPASARLGHATQPAAAQ